MDRVHGPSSRVHCIGTLLGSSNPRSMIRILCSGRVSTHLISVVRARSDGEVVGPGRWWCGRTHTAAAPLELAREGSGWRSEEGISSLSGLKWTRGGGDSHPRQDTEGNNSSMACGGSFPPPSTVDGERCFWSSSSPGAGLGSSWGSMATRFGCPR
jgi:hypothetical protein